MRRVPRDRRSRSRSSRARSGSRGCARRAGTAARPDRGLREGDRRRARAPSRRTAGARTSTVRPGLAQHRVEAGREHGLALHVHRDAPDVGRGQGRLPLGRGLLAGIARRGRRRAPSSCSRRPASRCEALSSSARSGRPDRRDQRRELTLASAPRGTPRCPRPPGTARSSALVPQYSLSPSGDRWLAVVGAEVVGVGPRVAADHRRAQELPLAGSRLVVDAERDRRQHRERRVGVAVDDLAQARAARCACSSRTLMPSFCSGSAQ